MGWIITCVALILLLFFGKKGFAGVNMGTKLVGLDVNTLDQIIQKNSDEYKVPAALIKAIIKKESSWNIDARNPSDPSYGLMGIMPITAQDYGIVSDYKNPTLAEIDSIFVPQNNIGAGCKLLHKLMTKYTADIAVEMYNVGERGYNELGRRNSQYRTSVMNYYYNYLNEEAGV